MKDIMRYRILTYAAIAAAALLAASCRKADELPPLNEGYATTIILPDGVVLTEEEWEYLDSLDEEYDKAIK